MLDLIATRVPNTIKTVYMAFKEILDVSYKSSTFSI